MMQAITLALTGIAVLLLGILLLRGQRVDLSALVTRLDSLDRAQERAERAVRDEMARGREESLTRDRSTREELSALLRHNAEVSGAQSATMQRVQNEQLSSFAANLTALTDSNSSRLDAVRETIEQKLQQLQVENSRKLDEMRQTVDEKLQGTLETRLGESFRLVSERLEQVHKGLGEMQALAAGVGDLKKALTNVKTRGTWGEVQLGALLEQILSPEQFEANVCTKGDGRERVEFAIKLPGNGDGTPVWLPIDAKFPQEDYLRLVDAQERGEPAAAELAVRQLELRVKDCARDIAEKYVAPPATTDFAILFLPTEGLYAEVIRRTMLVDALQQDWRVVIAGPTTLAALLNSLRMGFRSLAIQQRSSEVWTVLGQVKTEFHRFGDTLDRVKKKLQEASNVVDKASTRSRAIEKRLRGVETLPAPADSLRDELALVSETTAAPPETDLPIEDLELS
jgi:DNA recombination protein RmuC